MFSQRNFRTSWECAEWEVWAFPLCSGAGREGRKEQVSDGTRGREKGPGGRKRDRGPLPRGSCHGAAAPPQPPTAQRLPAGTAWGSRGQPPALLCTMPSCGFQNNSPLSAQVWPLGYCSPRRPVLPCPRVRRGLSCCQPLGATPLIRGLVSTQGPPPLGEPQASESISVGLKSFVFSSLGAEGGNVSRRCLPQLPKGSEPSWVPRALLLGTVRVLRDP